MADATRSGRWWIYSTPPIDWWDGTHSLEDFVAHMARQASDPAVVEAGVHLMTRLVELGRDLADAMSGFKAAGWEGDVREGPFVFSVPAESDMQWGLVLKQDNNGGTFVASPVPMPHLHSL